jgi:comEA protein
MALSADKRPLIPPWAALVAVLSLAAALFSSLLIRPSAPREARVIQMLDADGQSHLFLIDLDSQCIRQLAHALSRHALEVPSIAIHTLCKELENDQNSHAICCGQYACEKCAARLSGSQRLAGGFGLDLNDAGSEELCAIPGIGPARAKAIIEDRSQRGPYGSVEELTRVKGIGFKTMSKLRKFLSVD